MPAEATTHACALEGKPLRTLLVGKEVYVCLQARPTLLKGYNYIKKQLATIRGEAPDSLGLSGALPSPPPPALAFACSPRERACRDVCRLRSRNVPRTHSMARSVRVVCCSHWTRQRRDVCFKWVGPSHALSTTSLGLKSGDFVRRRVLHARVWLRSWSNLHHVGRKSGGSVH